ncbi:MAG: hypothetical protein WBB86_01060 [Candidatus Omnitrophota bacterium]
MMKFCPLFSVVPATILLIVSFFVLFAAERVGSKGLKTFGWVLAVLLWIYAAGIVSMGTYAVMSGGQSLMMKCPMMQQMQESSK